MNIKVTEQGVLIPKELLGNSQEVEVTTEEDKIIMKIKKDEKAESLKPLSKPRKPGYWKGKVKMADDFDVLPDSVQNGFMGLNE